jgi:hypothetical protein
MGLWKVVVRAGSGVAVTCGGVRVALGAGGWSVGTVGEALLTGERIGVGVHVGHGVGTGLLSTVACPGLAMSAAVGSGCGVSPWAR